jgi:hypothetical protein
LCEAKNVLLSSRRVPDWSEAPAVIHRRSDLQVTLWFQEGVLGLRKILESRTGPVAMIGAHIKHVAWRESEALQSGEKDCGTVVRQLAGPDAGEPKAQRRSKD